jgi:hypothetical protein
MSCKVNYIEQKMFRLLRSFEINISKLHLSAGTCFSSCTPKLRTNCADFIKVQSPIITWGALILSQFVLPVSSKLV